MANGHGGERPGAGKPPGPSKETLAKELHAAKEKLSGVPKKGPRGIDATRQHMTFHLWRASIYQRRVAGQPEGGENKDDLKALAYHLQQADYAGRALAQFETPRLSSMKHIPHDQAFDSDVSALPDDQLAALGATFFPLIAGPKSGDSGSAAPSGDHQHGGRPPVGGEGPGGTDTTRH